MVKQGVKRANKNKPAPMSGMTMFVLVMFFLLSAAVGFNIADGLSANLSLLTGGS